MQVGLKGLESPRQTKNVHRLVAEAFVPKETGRNVVDHINGNPSDNRASNLRWVTQGENVRLSHARLQQQGFRVDRKKVPVRATADDGAVYLFESMSGAIRWLQENGRFGGRPNPNAAGACTNIRRVCGVPGRRAYGYVWEEVDKATVPPFEPKSPLGLAVTEENMIVLKQALDEARTRIVFLEKTVPEMLVAAKGVSLAPTVAPITDATYKQQIAALLEDVDKLTQERDALLKRMENGPIPMGPMLVPVRAMGPTLGAPSEYDQTVG